MAYQPSQQHAETWPNLQQQKLKWLISPSSASVQIRGSTIVEIKMAYQPQIPIAMSVIASTIVEIKMAYQPSCEELPKIPESTIVEIKMAYQPYGFSPRYAEYLQQQKLKWLISLLILPLIYGHLQQQKLKWLISQLKTLYF